MTVRTASDGTRFEVVEGPGPAVLLVHGLGLNRHMWQWQRDAMAERYTVISYDLFGHGESPPPPETPSLTLFSNQLRRLLDELDVPRAAIAGFSLGGMIAQVLAAKYPRRVLSLTSIMSTSGNASSPNRPGRPARRCWRGHPIRRTRTSSSSTW